MRMKTSSSTDLVYTKKIDINDMVLMISLKFFNLEVSW